MIGPRDELDWGIIKALGDDPRATNKDLAKRFGVSEVTIAARIRWLQDNKIMLVTLQQDIYSRGIEFQCMAEIFTSGRRAYRVGKDLAELPFVTIVTLLVGRPEIIIIFNARDREEMLDIIYTQLASISGVEHVVVSTALEIRKYESNVADLVSR